MNKILLIILLGCTTNLYTQPATIINNCKIEINGTTEAITGVGFKSLVKDFNLIKVPTNSKLNFEDIKPIGETINFTNGFNQNPIYIFPLDTLIFSSDNKIFFFEGTRKQEWNFIFELKKIGVPILGFEGWTFNLPSKHDDFFKNAWNKKDSIQNYLKSKNFSIEYKYLINRDIECSFISTITRLEREMNTKNRKEVFDYFKKYENYFLKETKRNSWTFYTGLMDWNQYLTNYSSPSIEKGISKTKYEFAGTDYDYGRNCKNRIEAAKLLKNPIRDEIIFELMRLRYRTNSWENVEEASNFLKYFQQNCENKEMIEEMNVLSSTFLKKNSISSNSKIWGETKMMSENERITNWNDFVNNNKENVIYVDFWASWCGPCIKEIKESYQNLKSFGNKKVKFANISIDENLDFWKSSIKKLKIENDRMNFVIDPKSELAKYFKASESIPRHALIDKEGNIRTMMAPGANSIMFTKTINDLINEK